MIKAEDYIKSVKTFFSFLPIEYNMTDITEKVNGNAFYDVQYRDIFKIISISYENIEDFLQVIVFKLNDGRTPDYDDKRYTLHLNALNSISFSKASKADLNMNKIFFKDVKADNELQRRLLKSAKDLRLAMRVINEL